MDKIGPASILFVEKIQGNPVFSAAVTKSKVVFVVFYHHKVNFKWQRGAN
jgi:hypothetical protein